MSDRGSDGEVSRGNATRTANLAVSFALLLVAALFLYMSLATLPYAGTYGPGPGFIPTWVSLGAVLACLWLIFQSWRGKYDDSGDAEVTRIRPSLYYLGAIGGILLLVPVIGLLPAIGLFVLVVSIGIERTPLWQGVAVSVGLTLGLYVLLVEVLMVPLPEGLIGFSG